MLLYKATYCTRTTTADSRISTLDPRPLTSAAGSRETHISDRGGTRDTRDRDTRHETAARNGAWALMAAGSKQCCHVYQHKRCHCEGLIARPAEWQCGIALASRTSKVYSGDHHRHSRGLLSAMSSAYVPIPVLSTLAVSETQAPAAMCSNVQQCAATLMNSACQICTPDTPNLPSGLEPAARTCQASRVATPRQPKPLRATRRRNQTQSSRAQLAVTSSMGSPCSSLMSKR